MRNTNKNRRLILRYLLRESKCPIRIKSIPEQIQLGPGVTITKPHLYIKTAVTRLLYGAPPLRKVSAEILNTIVQILQ